MRRRSKTINRDILVLAILTTLTVITWVAFDIYRALNKLTLPEILQEQLVPFDPTIDVKQIEKLKQRITIPENQLQEFQNTLNIEKEGTSSTTTQESQPEATQGGSLE
jgi:hypothetical protein